MQLILMTHFSSSIARFFHQLNRFFWSLYFLFSILIIGTIFGYICTFILFLIAKILQTIFPRVSKSLNSFTEKFYAQSIRMLLVLQPWLRYKTNIPNSFEFSQYIKANCESEKLLFIANHRSNLDTFLLISWIPGLRGVAKHTLFYNFILAPFMWVTGFIPVEKGSANSFIDGLQKVKIHMLKTNNPILIFPEGTRCIKGGPNLNKWSQSVFKIAIDVNATVIPIMIKNTDRVLGKGDLLITPFEPVEVKMLKPIESKNYKDFIQLSKAVHLELGHELA